jgi:hypothetical protein
VRQAAVRLAAAALREYLLDLIDPQHDRRHRFGERRRLAKISLGFADVFVVQAAGVELEKAR